MRTSLGKVEMAVFLGYFHSFPRKMLASEGLILWHLFVQFNIAPAYEGLKSYAQIKPFYY